MADEAPIPFTEHAFGGKLWQRFVDKSKSARILSAKDISALKSDIDKIVRVSKQANAKSKEFREAASEAELVIGIEIKDKMSADLQEAINPRLLRESAGGGGDGGAAGGRGGGGAAARGGDGGGAAARGGGGGNASTADNLSEKLDKVLDLLQEQKTETQIMSKVSQEFAVSLLTELGFSWTAEPTDSTSSDTVFEKFEWKGGELKSLPDAIEKLRKWLALDKIDEDRRVLEIVNFSSKSLGTLSAPHKKVSGNTDAVLRLSDRIQESLGCEFLFTIGAVEFKTIKYPIKFYQNLLELVSLSRLSQFRQAVVLLGTDLNGKWQIMWFDKPNHIKVQEFQSGPVAILRFKDLLKSINARQQALEAQAVLTPPALSTSHVTQSFRTLTFAQSLPSLPSTPEGQDLSGFDVPSNPAVEHQQFMQNMVNFFNDRYGANVTLPLSAYAMCSPDTVSRMYS